MSIILLMTCLCSLSEEVESFQDEYFFSGYTSQWSRALYLSISEPFTILIYPGPNLEGVLCGVGGNAVLYLGLELNGGNLNIVDKDSADLPVLQFITGSEPVAYTVTVTALDMLYGATAESVYVFFAMRPFEQELENSVPVEPDSAITGE